MDKELINDIIQKLIVSQEPQLMAMFVQSAIENSVETMHDMWLDHEGSPLPHNDDVKQHTVAFMKDMLDEFYREFEKQVNEATFDQRRRIIARVNFA